MRASTGAEEAVERTCGTRKKEWNERGKEREREIDRWRPWERIKNSSRSCTGRAALPMCSRRSRAANSEFESATQKKRRDDAVQRSRDCSLFLWSASARTFRRCRPQAASLLAPTEGLVIPPLACPFFLSFSLSLSHRRRLRFGSAYIHTRVLFYISELRPLFHARAVPLVCERRGAISRGKRFSRLALCLSRNDDPPTVR